MSDDKPSVTKHDKEPTLSAHPLHVVLEPESQVELKPSPPMVPGVVEWRHALGRMPRRGWLIIWVLTILLLVSTFPLYRYLFAKSPPLKVIYTGQKGDLVVAFLHYPLFVPLGDESAIDIEVTNQSDEDITGSLLVVFPGSNLVRIEPASTNLMDLQDLQPGEKKRELIRFTPSSSSNRFLIFVDGTVTFALRFRSEVGDSKDLTPKIIGLAPVARLKALFVMFSSIASLLVIPLLKFLADTFVKPYLTYWLRTAEAPSKKVTPAG